MSSKIRLHQFIHSICIILYICVISKTVKFLLPSAGSLKSGKHLAVAGWLAGWLAGRGVNCQIKSRWQWRRMCGRDTDIFTLVSRLPTHYPPSSLCFFPRLRIFSGKLLARIQSSRRSGDGSSERGRRRRRRWDRLDGGHICAHNGRSSSPEGGSAARREERNPIPHYSQILP